MLTTANLCALNLAWINCHCDQEASSAAVGATTAGSLILSQPDSWI